MVVLVTGANGQLGNEMRIVARNDNNRYIFTDINATEGNDTTYLDITDLNSIRTMVAECQVDVIVNCAAYTNVDEAENNRTLAESINALAPENLAIAMREVGGLLIHISTDYVFGGEKHNTPCDEELQAAPTGIYGWSKLQGEQRIAATGCRHIIIRTAWLYSEYGKNFCKTMMTLTATKPHIKVVYDQVGTPTYALDLAHAIAVVIEKYDGTQTGVYHYSNEGVCSWYDFAKMVAEYNGTIQCDIQPCRSSEFPSPVVRPSYSVLDKSKIKHVFGVEVPYWTQSLKQCINHINKQ